MPSTYTPIATSTITSSSSAITFSSVPQTYTDLVVVINSKFTQTSGRFISLQYNSDTGANYTSVYLLGQSSGTATAYATGNSSARIGNGSASSASGSCVASIFDYTNATTYKTSSGRTGSNEFAITYMATWKSTAAISTVTVTCDTASSNAFATGSTFSLYGIKRA